MKRAVVLFTRDLRVHDQPAMSAATEIAAEIVPMFAPEYPKRIVGLEHRAARA